MKLSDLKALAQAATPGPWVAMGSNTNSGGVWQRHGNVTGRYIVGTTRMQSDAEDQTMATLPFIAALSPEVVLALIACVEAADAMRRAYRLDGQTADMPYDRARAALEELKR